MGTESLKVAAFRQMCGRAGRMGYNTDGEAILMIGKDNRHESELAKHLITSDLELLKSSLSEGYGGGIEKLLLEMICCDKLKHSNQVSEFIKCTLYYVQTTDKQQVSTLYSFV